MSTDVELGLPEHVAAPRGSRSPAPRVGFVLHVMQVAGAEVLVQQTIERLADRIRPTVFCLDALGALGEQLRAEGVDVVCLGRRPGRDWRTAWRLARELRQRKIDVIHAHQYTPFFYSAVARILAGFGPKLVFTEHGRHFPDVVSRKRRLANRWVLSRLTQRVNAVCEFSRQSLATSDGFDLDHIEVIENGIDAAHYVEPVDRRELRARLGLDQHRRYLACVARFHPVKDHATLLRAFARLAPTHPEVELLLVGDGPLRADLEQQVRQLQLDSRVRFLGVRRDVPDLLRAVDLFCMTSVSEAASLTVLEAMAAGLPVVVTRVGGNPELVRHEIDGLLVSSRDPEAIADALARLLHEPMLRAALGEAGRQRVRERFLLEHTVEAYGRLYEGLYERTSRPSTTR